MSVSRVQLRALSLVALLGAAGACTRGHDDDDDPSLLGVVGPISEFPKPGLDAAVVAPGTGSGGSGSEDMGSNGGSAPITGGDALDAGIAAPPFFAQDAGTSAAGDAGAQEGDAGGDADAGDAGSDTDAAPACWLLCP